MFNYLRKPVEVQAWLYSGQNPSEWPQFVKDYKALTVFGPAAVSKTNDGLLLIPQTGEQSGQAASYGDWVVMEHDKLIVVKSEKFSALYEANEG